MITKRQGGGVAIPFMHPQFTKQASFQDRFDRQNSAGHKWKHEGNVEVCA